MDVLNRTDFSRPRALRLAGLIAALNFAGIVLRWSTDTGRGRFFFRVWTLMWSYGHRVEQRQSVSWHKQHSTGEKESIMTKNVDKVGGLAVEGVFEAAPALMRMCLTTLGISVLVGWWLGLLAATTIVVFLSTAALTNRFLLAKPRYEARQEERQLEKFGNETTANWRTLKYFGAEKRRCDENQALLNRFYVSETKRFRKLIAALLTQEIIINLSRAAFWVIVIFSFKPNITTIGSIVLASTWIERIYSNFHHLSSFQRRLDEAIEPFGELTELVLNVPEIRQPEHPKWPDLKGRVEFKNVTFTYPGGDEPVISDFSLTAEPNQTIALVGLSGCGKSSAAELLMRSYDPDLGQVLLDGVDLRELDYDKFRQVVAIVNQDVELFDMSIRENIRFSRPEATDDEVVFAAKQACAHDFIIGLPEGYDYVVGQNGIRLSGGQKQRVAIARALLRQPRLLVLDEATSSLDAESQRRRSIS